MQYFSSLLEENRVLKHFYILLLFTLCLLLTTIATHAQSNLSICKKNKIYFDGQCRGAKFFKKFSAPDYELLEVSGCNSLGSKGKKLSKGNKPDQCGGSFFLTENSQSLGVTRQLLISAQRNRRSGIAREIQQNSAVDFNQIQRNGYQVMHIGSITTTYQSQTFNSTQNMLELNENTKQLQEVFSSKLSVTAGQQDASGILGPANMQVCAHIKRGSDNNVLDMLSETVVCNDETSICELSTKLNGYTPESPDITTLTVKFDKSQKPTLRNKMQCISGKGNVVSLTAMASGGGGAGTGSNQLSQCSSHLQGTLKLNDNVCKALIGNVRFFATNFTSSFLAGLASIDIKVEGGLSTGDIATGDVSFDGEAAVATGFETYNYFRDSYCGSLAETAVHAQFGAFCGQACQGQTAPVDVTFTTTDGRFSCDGTVVLNCSSSNPSSQIGDPDCNCEPIPSTQVVDENSCKEN